VGLGREVGDILLRLEYSEYPINYVMVLSSIYVDAYYWKECERIIDL